MTGRQAMLWAATLIPATLLPAALRMVDVAYGIGAILLGLVFLAMAVRFAMNRSTRQRARSCFYTSITYLPLLWILMAADADLILMSYSDLPALNATLNATSAVLVTTGWFLIKSKRIAAHRRVHDRRLRCSSLFFTFLRHLSREDRIEAVSGNGRDADGVLFDSDPARHGGGGLAADGDHDAQARIET